MRTEYLTPSGALSCVERKTEHGFSKYFVEYLVKDVKDLNVLRFILDHTVVEFDEAKLEQLREFLGNQGMIWLCLPRTPLQRLFIDYIGFERTIRFLYRYRSEMEGLIEDIESTDDDIYELVAESPLRIVNFGDNVDSRLTSPSLFKKYNLPYYQERSAQLHRKGKYIHCHVDGYFKPLLNMFRDTGWDGVEALTPKPTGDANLDEIKNGLGDEMILIDGIPFYCFLPYYCRSDFERVSKEVLDMFQNRLILGISDEMPPEGELDKLRLVPRIISERSKK